LGKPRLHAITFLAPNMLPVYRFMFDYLGSKLGCDIELTEALDYREMAQSDLALICGLPYIIYNHPQSFHEALIAPVLQGERFQNRPIYFSDVIVRRDSAFQSFADLRGCSWAYNEPLSQSGYGITRYSLVKKRETNGYFSKVIEAGFHEKSIRMVCHGDVDASAIDTQVLAVELRNQPQLAQQLRVIDSLGPSTIQPLTAANHLPTQLKQDIQALLSKLHHDPASRAYLEMGFIDHFTAVKDADYDDIRDMLKACEEAMFLVLK
jgi:phosphonate transport system substrate-binding protein